MVGLQSKFQNIKLSSKKFCLFNVTVDNISVIYVISHKSAGRLKKKFDLLLDSHVIDI